MVIPRGIVFSVENKDAAARGYILEAQNSTKKKYALEWLDIFEAQKKKYILEAQNSEEARFTTRL